MLVGISEAIRLLSTCLLISMLYVLSLVVLGISRLFYNMHPLRWKISKLIENYSILYLTNNTNDPNSGRVSPQPTDTKISTNLSIDSNNNSSPTDDGDANSKFNE